MHPRTRAKIEQHKLGSLLETPGLLVLAPIGYLEMLGLMQTARLALTDSGGVQEETTALGVPCVTLRENTEWVETVETGWNRLVGSDPARIVEAARDAAAPAEHPPLYGDGHAADSIADLVCTMDRK